MLDYTTLQQTVPGWREGDVWLVWLQALPNLDVLFWLTTAMTAGLAVYTHRELATPAVNSFRRRMVGLLSLMSLAALGCALALGLPPSSAWEANHGALLEALALPTPSDKLPSRSQLLAVMGPHEVTLAQLKVWEAQLAPEGVSPEAFHQFADIFLTQQRTRP